MAKNPERTSRNEAGERPAQRDAPAPTVEISPGEQRGEDEPGNHREHGLVVELHRPPEQRFREHDAGEKGQRQEREPREDHAEQQPLHGKERRQRGERPDDRAAVQPSFHERHQKRVQRRDREHAVGDHGERKVQTEFGRMRVRQRGEPGEERGQRHAYGGEREDRRLHAFELEESAFDPIDQHGEPQHHRERMPETEAQLGMRPQHVVDQPGMQREGRENRRPLPSGEARHARAAPARAPEVKGERRVEEERCSVE